MKAEVCVKVGIEIKNRKLKKFFKKGEMRGFLNALEEDIAKEIKKHIKPKKDE